MAAGTIKPYLTGSAALHAALVVAAAFLSSRSAGPKATQVYTIDFVGPSATIQQAAPAAEQPAAAAATVQAGPAAPAKPTQQMEFDEFGRRKGKQTAFVLPRPSLLRGWKERPSQETPAPTNTGQPTNSAQPTAAASAAGSGTPGDAGVAMDMPNFPYPWYISQVRAALWNQWSARMPKTGGTCVIGFSLMRNGAVVDLRTEESSGDSSYDLTAMSAVQDAAPYPPLPRDFAEPFLKIHVTLKSL